MKVDRREFLLFAAGSALACDAAMASGGAPSGARVKAIAFDAFPIFDPRPVATRAEALFPGQGSALMSAWRTRQFEYQWLRALSGRYADFLQATEAALLFSARQLNLAVSVDQKQQLMAGWSNLEVWPDVPEAIEALHQAGLRLVILSNMTRQVLAQGLQKARLGGLFEDILSTDQIRSYKPDPRAYQLAIDRLKLRRDEILFAPSAGWDVAGAKWFGYPTYWVNRLNAAPEELGVDADGTGPDLRSLVRSLTGPEAATSG